MNNIVDVSAVKLPNITLDELANLQNDIEARQGFLRQRINVFEARYHCSLSELEQQLENREIAEHPAWEDSIEWRNAFEQLEQSQLSESIFTWLQKLLTPSLTS
jgi:hypothetical protein